MVDFEDRRVSNQLGPLIAFNLIGSALPPTAPVSVYQLPGDVKVGSRIKARKLKAKNAALHQAEGAILTRGKMEHTLEEVRPSVPSVNHAQLLIAEDDVPLAHFLRRGFETGYGVDVVHDGESALNAVNGHQYNLVILDLNLPKLDGMSLLKQLRPTKPNLPVLVLTGRSQLEDRVSALDGGADDCLIKPFSFHELNARVRALLRRNGTGSTGVQQVGDLLLSRAEFRVERGGKAIHLTVKEFALLEYLMMNAKRPVTRAQIMENVWKAPYDPSTNLVDVYVKYVRDKVDLDAPTKLIRTIRRVGYVLSEN